MSSPEEFAPQPDTYEGIVPMWVDADHYLDGQLVHAARRPAASTPPEHAPGWTVVQGAPHGTT